MSVPLIEQSGFPSERITVLNNAVDTLEFSNMVGSVKQETLQQLREELGLKSTKIVYISGHFIRKNESRLC
jgi:hypothetical protein